MQIGLDEIRAIRRTDKRSGRVKVLAALVVLLALALLYLCTQGLGYPMLTPATVFRNLTTFFHIKSSQLHQGEYYLNSMEITVSMPYYAWTVSRFQSLLLMLLSGAVLSLSGTVYQSAMRNPMAVPTMLGVSSGVSLAQMVMVLLYAESVYTVTTMRYILSYGFALGTLLIILICAKIVGRKKSSVADMLIVGTVINRIFRIVMNYLQSNMDSDTLYLYQDYAQNSQDYFSTFADLGMLVLVAGVVLLPIFLMRFSYNMVCFEDDDARTLGVRPGIMRTYGLIAGGVLTATAMIHAGNIGMLATVVPLLCRYVYGANFRHLIGTSALWGGITLVVANLVRSFTYVGTYQIPLGNIVSLLSVPLLLWIMWAQKSAWSTTEH